MRPRAAVVAAAAAALMFAGAAARAHDLWIEPTRFAPAAGEVVGLRLLVGEHFVGEPCRASSRSSASSLPRRRRAAGRSPGATAPNPPAGFASARQA